MFLLCAILFAIPALATLNETQTFLAIELRPYMFIDSAAIGQERYSGWLVDFGKELGFDIVYIEQNDASFVNAVQQVLDGNHDTVIGTTITAARSPFLVFTQAYLQTGFTVVVPIESKGGLSFGFCKFFFSILCLILEYVCSETI